MAKVARPKAPTFNLDEQWLLLRSLMQYEAQLLGLPSPTCPVEDIPEEPPPERAEEYYAAMGLRGRIQHYLLAVDGPYSQRQGRK